MGTRKITSLSLFVCSLFAGVVMLSSCQEKQVEAAFIINMPYSEARQIILQNGWMPVQGERSDMDAESRVPHFYYDAGYVEVAACSGTGMGYCSFKFKNQEGQFLKVTSQGGDYDPNDLSQPVVINIGISND